MTFGSSDMTVSIRRLIAQLARFGVVGVVVNIGLYGLYLAITSFGAAPIATSALCFAIGVPISFVAHSRISFLTSDSIAKLRKLLFVGAYLAGFALQISGLYFLHNVILFPHQWSQLAMMIVVAAFLFATQKYFVFQK